MLSITPFIQSDDSRCGPAAVRIVLGYYGIDSSEDEISSRCGWTYEDGCNDAGMKRALESFGLGVQIWNNATLNDLRYWTDHKVPVIIDWFTGASHSPEVCNGHSSVVVGVDRTKVWVMDPWDGEVKGVLLDDFMRLWFDFRGAMIKSWDQMVIRQIIIAYPSRITEALL